MWRNEERRWLPGCTSYECASRSSFFYLSTDSRDSQTRICAFFNACFSIYISVGVSRSPTSFPISSLSLMPSSSIAIAVAAPLIACFTFMPVVDTDTGEYVSGCLAAAVGTCVSPLLLVSREPPPPLGCCTLFLEYSCVGIVVRVTCVSLCRITLFIHENGGKHAKKRTRRPMHSGSLAPTYTHVYRGIRHSDR